MEYLDGYKPLRKVVGSEQSPFHRDAKRSLEVYIQVLKALLACEQAGIAHRDLSLGNVLYNDKENRGELIDLAAAIFKMGAA